MISYIITNKPYLCEAQIEVGSQVVVVDSPEVDSPEVDSQVVVDSPEVDSQVVEVDSPEVDSQVVEVDKPVGILVAQEVDSQVVVVDTLVVQEDSQAVEEGKQVAEVEYLGSNNETWQIKPFPSVLAFGSQQCMLYFNVKLILISRI